MVGEARTDGCRSGKWALFCDVRNRICVVAVVRVPGGFGRRKESQDVSRFDARESRHRATWVERVTLRSRNGQEHDP